MPLLPSTWRGATVHTFWPRPCLTWEEPAATREFCRGWNSVEGLYLNIWEISLQEVGAGIACEEKHQFGLLQVTRIEALLDLSQCQGKLTPVYHIILSSYPNSELPCSLWFLFVFWFFFLVEWCVCSIFCLQQVWSDKLFLSRCRIPCMYSKSAEF